MSKQVEKSFMLDEVEDFELGDSETVKAFTLEKDVQLMGVAFDDCVHVFEFDEEVGDEETGLSYVTKLDMSNVSKMIFVEYHLVLMQEDGTTVTLGCADLDSASVEKAEVITKANAEAKLVIRSGVDATDLAAIYFANGTQLGKIEVPAMKTHFMVESGHTSPIQAMSVASQHGQIITASSDETVRFFSCASGKPCFEPMDDMENCDVVNALGANLIMRVGSGEERAILLWKLKETGGIEEESLNEIELNEDDRKLHE